MDRHWEQRQSDWKPKPGDARKPFDVDYARIIHSASFRRLQGKTQILNLGDSDFYRTRLTHSLEVAQIARGIVLHMREHKRESEAYDYIPDEVLIESIGLAHDLGHPPFGHGGEVALNYCMQNDGGFEGNGQTIRILSKLEYFSADHGADLTRRTLLGLLKYPAPYATVVAKDHAPKMDKSAQSTNVLDRQSAKPPKCFLDSEVDTVKWILDPLGIEMDEFQSTKDKAGSHSKTKYKSFDCTIMDIADEIAYGAHDLEDAIALGLIRRDEFQKYLKEEDFDHIIDYLKNEGYKNNLSFDSFMESLFRGGRKRKQSIGQIVSYLISKIDIVKNDGNFANPIIKYEASLAIDARNFLKLLMRIVFEEVIKSPNVQHLEFKGQQMVIAVFEVIASDPESFLPIEYFDHFKKRGGDQRVICDYVAGMTDGHLLRTYDRLFSPRMGSVFDKL